MTREAAIHLACLYGPVAGAALLAWWVRPSKRLATGLLFALLWNAAMLPWLDSLARAAGLWSYRSQSAALGGMPLSLYFGWILAWGVCAPLLSKAMGGRTWIAVALLVAIDLRTMPEMAPVLELHPLWWLGEAACVAILLLPSLFIVRTTVSREKLEIRCGLLAAAFGGVFLGLPALLVCGDLEGVILRWQAIPGPARAFIPAGIFLFSVPGLTAARDLARSGGGTPVPLDPPERLVTHGIYAFVRNPMQLSMTLLLMGEALLLATPWPALMALMGLVYSEGFARWSENEDMRARFGEKWTTYRREIRPWFPRWKPLVGETCELWIDDSCGPCSEIRQWFEDRQPAQLELRRASEWQGIPLERVTWRHPASGRMESGVAAIAMGLQHLHLGYASLGWAAGLPGISHLLQICFDAAGAGKRQAVE